MKLNHLAILVVLFIIVSFLLSIFKIISITFTDILSYSLLIIGIALVYGESIRQNRLTVFLGSIIFLVGVYFLVSENFELTNSVGMSIPVILILAGSGLLVLRISTSANRIFLIISIILLTAGLTLLLMNSHWSIGSFIQSFLPVLNFLWPALIILMLIVLFLKTR
ncbi:MAG TPA: hypothetical protein VLH59_09725 [Ignavibacteriaceae bacterium]|nr:hypothetical protein [Ignavibacteriaceae bacterium]